MDTTNNQQTQHLDSTKKKKLKAPFYSSHHNNK